ncbi:MAG: uridine kinase [Flavobacteriaceae bacterium]|nr:uridine kinase [Flavobacteriaceae bacterium]
MQNPYLVGITGGSASGKTHLLQSLRGLFAEHELCIVSQDNYYKPLAQQVADENGVVNYDLPSCIDLGYFLSDLEKLKSGQSITKTEYVFNNPGKAPETIVVKPAPIIVIEGLFIYYFEKIFRQLQLKVFVDASEDIKWQRRMLRDRDERGIPHETIEYQWQHHVKPAYDQFLLPFREASDIIVMNNTHIDQSLQVLAGHFRDWLGKPV